MIQEIVHDEAALAVPAVPATADDAHVAQDLLDTIASMEDVAVMLAANQIGSDKAIIAYLGTDDKHHVMYNPKLLRAMRPQKSLEGCLSIEGETVVTRFQTITVAYEDLVDGKLVARSRKFTDFTAEAIQHGIDHCKGVLI